MVDICLSAYYFILSANTLKMVYMAVVDQCEFIFLDQYLVAEKIAITR